MAVTPKTVVVPTADQFAERVFASALGTLDTWAMYVGDKLGLYTALAEKPLTGEEFTATTGMEGRYAQEWLEHQVTSGIVTVDDPGLLHDERRYTLPEGPAEVLTDPDSLGYLAPFVRLITAAGNELPSLLEAYRTGGGVPWSQYGPDMRTGQAEMNRPWFLGELGTSWFPMISHVHDRLSAPARLADFGCGEGWSSIGIAQAYPEATVVGFDIDEPSIEAARRHAQAGGVADRVSFELVDAGRGVEGSYDIVTAFECIHDMPDPVSVLRTMRDARTEGGTVIVMDEAVADAFGESHDGVERIMYGFSLFICLPDGRSHQPSAATGTVMRQATLERYAREAGFGRVSVLPIENDLWRFYELSD